MSTDKGIIKTESVSVTPQFTLPPGLDEGTYVTSDTDGDSGYELSQSDVDSYGIPPDIDDVSGGEQLTLATPEVIEISSETIRFGADGKQVVDVVLTIQDVDGAQTYEVRVSKQ